MSWMRRRGVQKGPAGMRTPRTLGRAASRQLEQVCNTVLHIPSHRTTPDTCHTCMAAPTAPCRDSQVNVVGKIKLITLITLITLGAEISFNYVTHVNVNWACPQPLGCLELCGAGEFLMENGKGRIKNHFYSSGLVRWLNGSSLGFGTR